MKKHTTLILCLALLACVGFAAAGHYMKIAEEYEEYKKAGFHFKTLISPGAIISKTAQIGEGCMIQSLCNVSSNSVLGHCVRINTGANIMHDVNIGDFSVAAPNAVVLGHVSIGNGSYLGANCTILPHLRVGDAAVVGAGAVVTKNVADKAVVAGVPARILRIKE